MLKRPGKSERRIHAGDATTRLLARIAFMYWFIWMTEALIGLRLFGDNLPFSRLIPFLFALTVLFIQAGRGKAMHWSGAAKWILFYFLWAGCSLVWSTASDIGLSVWVWIMFGAELLFVCLTMSCPIDREAVLKSTFAGLVAGGACMSLQVISIFQPGADLKSQDGLHPNFMGHRIAIAALCALYLWSQNRRSVWAIGLPLLVIALFLTTSKGALIAFLFFALLFVFSPQNRLSRRRKLQVVALLVVISAIALQFVGRAFHVYEAKGGADTLSGRAVLWVQVIPKILIRPFVGYGFASFADNWPANRWYTGQAHNELLQQWFTLGLIGVTLLALTYWKLFRALWRSTSDSSRFGIYLLGYCLVRGFVEADDSHVILALLFCFSLNPRARSSLARARRPNLRRPRGAPEKSTCLPAGPAPSEAPSIDLTTCSKS